MSSVNLAQLVDSLGLELSKVALHNLDGFLLELELRPFGDLSSSTFLGPFRLASVMLGLDVSVKSWIGEVALTTAALKISAFFVFSGPS